MSEAKAGPCPACGNATATVEESFGSMSTWRVECGAEWDCVEGPCESTYFGAIFAWNGIRARVLREAAEIAGRLADSECKRPGYILGPMVGEGCWHQGCMMAEKALTEAAERAERGEP